MDDNGTMRRLLGHLTKSWGMMPLLVSLSYSAIDLIQKGVAPDVAIIDVSMPDLNGIVLAEKIHRYRKDLPLIILTSIAQMHQICRFNLQDCEGRSGKSPVSRPWEEFTLLQLNATSIDFTGKIDQEYAGYIKNLMI